MEKPKVALQTWTVRRELKLGVYREKLLERIRSYGIEYLELGGMGGLSPKPFRGLCKKYGFQVMGLHEPPLTSGSLSLLLDEIRMRCAIFHARSVAVAWDTNQRRDVQAYSAYADLCSQAAPILRQDGITLSYHCYDFDLKPLGKGSDQRSGLDILLEQTSEHDLLFQLDTFFVWKASCQLKAVLDKCATRCKLVHVDDIDNRGVHAPLGRGRIPWLETIGHLLRMCPIEWFIIEHKVPEAQNALDWVYKSGQYWRETIAPLVERMVCEDGKNVGE